MSALEFKNVSHAYEQEEVTRDVSLALKRNEIICILGPSGCGKTTLLRLAAGLEKLRKGTILIDDEVVSSSSDNIFAPPEKRHIGLMFQDLALFPHLTVMQNIMFGVTERREERERWVRHMLERLGLSGRGGNYPHALSGGERQRVALIRALAPRPSVLFLDEPFSSLDTNRRLQMREDTVHLLKDERIAAMMVTHDPEEALFMADSIIVMNEGKIIQKGASQDVFLNPASAFVANLFGPTNRFEGVVENGHVKTPLGSFDAKGIEEGKKAEILIRPDAVSPFIGKQHDGKGNGNGQVTSAVVTVSHFMGRASCLHIEVDDKQDKSGTTFPEIRARSPLKHTPAIGAKVRFIVDTDHVFVFPL